MNKSAKQYKSRGGKSEISSFLTKETEEIGTIVHCTFCFNFTASPADGENIVVENSEHSPMINCTIMKVFTNTVYTVDIVGKYRS